MAGTLIAVLLTIGAMFAAANTMFAAVSSRTREIGTMRALGFSRFDILISFLGESVLLCALGGPLGLLATLPLSALTFGTSNFNTFAEVDDLVPVRPARHGRRRRDDLAMGVFGGLFPAIRAVRLDVIRPASCERRAIREPDVTVERRTASRAILDRSSGVLEHDDPSAAPAASRGSTSIELAPAARRARPGRTSRNRSTGWMFRLIFGVL